MTVDEILELMELRGWSQTKLAAELDLSHAAVWKWMSEQRVPRGPAQILMRQWLDEARAKHRQKNGKTVRRAVTT